MVPSDAPAFGGGDQCEPAARLRLRVRALPRKIHLDVPDSLDPADAAILIAHRTFLDSAIDVLRHGPSEMDRPSAFVLVALAVRLIQRAAAAHTLCVQGYGTEASPLLRSMLSALASIIYVAQDNSDSRALAFMADETRIANNRLPRLESQGLLTAEEAQRFLNESTRTNIERIAHYEALGINTDAPNQGGRTWHGYANDEQFFASIGLKPWYDSFYASLSEDSHASVWSIFKEMKSLALGDVAFGPHYEGTRFAVSSSYAFVSRCLAELDQALGLNQQGPIATIAETMRWALARTL